MFFLQRDMSDYTASITGSIYKHLSKSSYTIWKIITQFSAKITLKKKLKCGWMSFKITAEPFSSILIKNFKNSIFFFIKLTHTYSGFRSYVIYIKWYAAHICM